MTRAGSRASRARALSPADAMDRQTSPGRTSRASSRTSASSQHWAYRTAEKSALAAASEAGDGTSVVVTDGTLRQDAKEEKDKETRRQGGKEARRQGGKEARRNPL